MHSKDEIYKQLENLEQELHQFAEERKDLLEQVSPAQKNAAINLLHYLAFRSVDLQILQDELHREGYSSLASSESHTLAQIQSVLKLLGKNYADDELAKSDYIFGKKSIKQNSLNLFGNGENAELPFIMVTFDVSFKNDYDYIEKLVTAGMRVARINCAHDDATVWAEMIQSLRVVSEKTGILCKVYMDLAGPKIRTEILGKGKNKGRVILNEGDRFYLAETAEGAEKKVVVGCSYPGLINMLKPGENVVFDDGEIETKIEKIEKGVAELSVLRNTKKKKNLKADKGINFPDSEINVPALTPYDISCIPFICEHADMVGYSFVKEADDVTHLQSELKKQNRQPNIILKIETPEAVKNLPLLLLQAMQNNLFGVMIARGDLAVEMGFERISEVQDKILWLAEAAHAPVIWATQVLETLHKTGIATRSEVTDAAHASMAECVMINKGDYTLEVIDTLRDILNRNKNHMYKKRYRLRPLQIAKGIVKG